MSRIFEPKLTWDIPPDNAIDDFYKPALIDCKLYQRLAGFWTSSSFATIAEEILDFVKSNAKMQIVTSPNMSKTDIDFLEQCINDESRHYVTKIFLDDLQNDPEKIKLEFTKILAYMLQNKVEGSPQLEMKIAIPKNRRGLYHQKKAIFHYRNGEKISIAGSVNETVYAWEGINKENFEVNRSWGDNSEEIKIFSAQKQFNNLWNNYDKEYEVIDLPDAIRQHVLSVRKESQEDIDVTLKKAKEIFRKKRKSTTSKPEPETETETETETEIKLRPYQLEGVEKWIKNNFCGLFAMATGTGKTFTAFGCINEIQKVNSRTVTIIACPQRHLVEQWKDEFMSWNTGVKKSAKIIFDKKITCDSDYSWKEEIQKISYNFNYVPLGEDNSIYNHVIIFTTHDTLGNPEFAEKIDSLKNTKKFLIVDEVHNITANKSINTLRDEYEFRLGLSATPVRHMDEEGTQILQDYFHGIVHELNLEDAIHKLEVLCKYEYYPYFVELTPDEIDVHRRLTSQIAQIEIKKRNGTYNPQPGEFDPTLARADLIQNAQNKDTMLEQILSDEFNNQLKHTLIYCTNDPSLASPNSMKQLERVKRILTRKGIDSDSVTWEDKTKDRLHILNLMEMGHFDCVTAVKCLDEGVDVPSVKIGIFMASSGNPKEFIQRRGRVLRRNEAIGKTTAKIYDILVRTPRPIEEDYKINLSERKMVAKELLRLKEFARISETKREAYEEIRPIVLEYGINLEQLNYEYIMNME